MKNFKVIFNKVKGWDRLREFAKAHILVYSLLITLCCGFSKKSLEIVRLATDNKLLKKLRKQYQKFVKEYLACNKIKKGEQSNIVWICWMQGMDNAPLLVQKCYESAKRYLCNKQIIVLTSDNYMDYVVFPQYIQKKIDKGQIQVAHMTDLLRLELLTNYGGTWVDATVLFTGVPSDSFFTTDLFVFQNLKPGLDGHALSISNWFISACKNEPILLLTKALLYEYWKKNDMPVNYYIFHFFFQIAAENFPNEWKLVLPFNNSTCHILLLRLFEEYDSQSYKFITSQSCVHKLSYKFTEENEKKEKTYYEELFRNQ